MMNKYEYKTIINSIALYQLLSFLGHFLFKKRYSAMLLIIVLYSYQRSKFPEKELIRNGCNTKCSATASERQPLNIG